MMVSRNGTMVNNDMACIVAKISSFFSIDRRISATLLVSQSTLATGIFLLVWPQRFQGYHKQIQA